MQFFHQASRISRRLRGVRRFEDGLRNFSSEQLLQRAIDLKFRILEGESMHRAAPESFALVCEAAHRTLQLRHFDVQLQAGFQLLNGHTIEMETGQGKTLTATLPLFVYAMFGKGAHLATSNDYLAERDASTMRPLFEMLGLSVGHVVDGMRDEQRRENYACDITYGTCPQFGFDFLRDRMKQQQTGRRNRPSLEPVQRPLFYVLADEADALLIDEANTPLVIGVKGKVSDRAQGLYGWAADLAKHAVEKQHFAYNLQEKQVRLTQAGRAWVRSQQPITDASVLELYEKIETAILVRRDFQRDQQYIVRGQEIVLINESTGRLGEGREWQEGIHQAIQAAEGLAITAPTTNAARLTVQGLFLSYQHMAGMTGTARAAASELRKVYGSRVIRIPTHQKSRRRQLPTKCFDHAQEKWVAICDEIQTMHRLGRPVLVGTRSVEQSEQLSAMLNERSIAHAVLNARQHASEAAVIADAGQLGRVTVATSMAGRGTDIKLPTEVLSLGGLHVIVTELHDSPRQDQQLFGRCARQGEPGTYRQFLSLEDHVLDAAFGTTANTDGKLKTRISLTKLPIDYRNPFGSVFSLLYAAQRTLENRRRKGRIAALYHEQRKLRTLWEMGRDPLLDAI